MKTLKQVNDHYQGTGYEVVRDSQGVVHVYFEKSVVWSFDKTKKVAEVVKEMEEMRWLEWGVNSCELPVVEAVKPLTIREKAALVAEANRKAEKRIQADILYTDDQFKRNGYGHYDCCPLPETNVKPVVDVPVITKSQAMDLGFCFQYHTNDIQVYRPDGSSFYATDIEQALTWISDGTHLCAYDEPPYCDIVITPLLSGKVPNPVSYWSEADAIPQTRMAKEATLLTALGYDPNEHWVNLSTGQIFTLDGDVLVGTTSEQRW